MPSFAAGNLLLGLASVHATYFHDLAGKTFDRCNGDKLYQDHISCPDNWEAVQMPDANGCGGLFGSCFECCLMLPPTAAPTTPDPTAAPTASPSTAPTASPSTLLLAAPAAGFRVCAVSGRLTNCGGDPYAWDAYPKIEIHGSAGDASLDGGKIMGVPNDVAYHAEQAAAFGLGLAIGAGRRLGSMGDIVKTTVENNSYIRMDTATPKWNMCLDYEGTMYSVDVTIYDFELQVDHTLSKLSFNPAEIPASGSMISTRTLPHEAGRVDTKHGLMGLMKGGVGNCSLGWTSPSRTCLA